MLNRLTVHRFKSIREADIEFGRVNLFIGGNGCGKSNILEAIGLLSACLGRGITDFDLNSKGVRLTPASIMKSSFKNEELPKTLEVHGYFDNSIDYKVSLSSGANQTLSVFSESAKANGKKIFGRSNRGSTPKGVIKEDRLDKQRGLWDQVKAVIDTQSELFDAFEVFSHYAIFSPQTDFLRGKRAKKSNLLSMGIHGEGITEAIRSFMAYHKWIRSEINKKEKNILHPKLISQLMYDCINLLWLPGWASGIELKKTDEVFSSSDIDEVSKWVIVLLDKYMHRTRNYLTVYDSSEGTLFLLFSALLLAHPDSPRIFSFDNVDSALNPCLTRSLVEKIIYTTNLTNNKNLSVGARQVFMTSHNPTSLDAFDLFDDQQRIFVVKRSKTSGHTEIVRLQPPSAMTAEDWDIAKGGKNLSQLWLDGEIDGACGEL